MSMSFYKNFLGRARSSPHMVWKLCVSWPASSGRREEQYSLKIKFKISAYSVRWPSRHPHEVNERARLSPTPAHPQDWLWSGRGQVTRQEGWPTQASIISFSMASVCLALPSLCCSMRNLFSWSMPALSCSMWDLALWPGIKPGPPALECGVFAIGLPGKSLLLNFSSKYFNFNRILEF